MKGYAVIFGPSPEGSLGGAGVLGFRGPGEPGGRRRLTWTEREQKRRRAKKARQARDRNRR